MTLEYSNFQCIIEQGSSCMWRSDAHDLLESINFVLHGGCSLAQQLSICLTLGFEHAFSLGLHPKVGV